MSTKIYNAYKFMGTMPELIKILKEIRINYQEYELEKLTKFKDYTFKKEYFKFLQKDYSMQELVNEQIGDLILADILEKEMQVCHNTPMNISSSAVVYFYENDIYVQFFGLNDRYIKEYMNKFVDFHYQDQTDMSNYDWYKDDWQNMSDERKKELNDDWNNREKVWGEIINDYDTFAESGLHFNFNPVDYKLTEFCNNLLNKIKNNK